MLCTITFLSFCITLQIIKNFRKYKNLSKKFKRKTLKTKDEIKVFILFLSRNLIIFKNNNIITNETFRVFCMHAHKCMYFYVNCKISLLKI